MITEREQIIVFDVDGTLANVDHRRYFVQGSKKDFDSFYDAMIDDTVFDHVRGICNMHYMNNWLIYICTGRPESYREITQNWLNNNAIFHHKLMMRPDDRRFDSDVDIKFDMLKEIQKTGDVCCVFDDRNQVVKMWRENGIPCFQVADGDF